MTGDSLISLYVQYKMMYQEFTVRTSPILKKKYVHWPDEAVKQQMYILPHEGINKKHKLTSFCVWACRYKLNYRSSTKFGKNSWSNLGLPFGPREVRRILATALAAKIWDCGEIKSIDQNDDPHWNQSKFQGLPSVHPGLSTFFACLVLLGL